MQTARGSFASKNLQQYGLPNKHSMLGLDNTITHTTGKDGLAFFEAGRGDNHPPLRPLGVGEERVYIPISQCPPSVRAKDMAAGRTRRSCIKNTSTGEMDLEVRWTKPRPSLFNYIDMGPKCWPARFKMFVGKMKLRGGWSWDYVEMFRRVCSWATGRLRRTLSPAISPLPQGPELARTAIAKQLKFVSKCFGQASTKMPSQDCPRL
jgi:hypothetical protein